MESVAKAFEEAVAEMLGWWWYRTGIEPDAVEGDTLRTLFEAVAFEVEGITTAFDRALEAAIPEAIFQAFGFERLKPAPARLTLRLSRSSPAPEDIPIPEGTRAQTPAGLGFRTLQATSLPQGQTYVDVPAECEVPGSQGNVPVGAVSVVKDAVPGIEAVTNITAGTGGVDEEPLEAAKERFARWIAAQAKGTLASIELAALGAEVGGLRPKRAKAVDLVLDPAVPLGEVRVYVDVEGDPTPFLPAVVQAVDSVRPAGVRVQAYAVTRVPVNVRVRLEGGQTGDIPMAQNAIYAYFEGLAIGEDVVRERLIAQVAEACPGVYAVRLIDPASDVSVGPYEVAVLGTVNVEVV
jgi:uncharacterized phage protein gp47/JayE